jgi:transposase
MVQIFCLSSSVVCTLNCQNCDAEKKLIQKRKLINQLHFISGWNKNRIMKSLGVSKHFVIKWTQSPAQDVTIDHRGWQAGERRKWTSETESRILEIYKRLKDDPFEFFHGATAIAQEWRKLYPDEGVPPLRTIGQIMKDLGLSQPNKKPRKKGAARYLCYPEKTVYDGALGRRVIEADFIVRRYLKGNGAPLHFIGFSAKKAPRLRYFERIEALTADTFIHACERFFDRFETPDVLKVDNAATFIGSLSGKRSLSKTALYLLNREICPVFSVPRRPFSQASIEGNNSVFARHFWNRRTFESLDDVDHQLGWFNESSLRYTGYKQPDYFKERKDFTPRVYFLRQVRESDSSPGEGSIDVLNEEILLPPPYINFFVIAEWNLSTETLTVSLEQDESLKKIKELDFTINKTTRQKLKKGGAHSFCI